MEYSETSLVYTSLDPEVRNLIQVGAEIIGDMSNEQDAQNYINDMNEDLAAAKLIDQNVQLTSEYMVWTAYHIDGTVESVDNEALRSNTTVQGVFVGVEFVVPENGVRTVAYKIRAQVEDADMMVVHEISAPVEQSKMSVEAPAHEHIKMGSLVNHYFQTLKEIEDPDFQDDLQGLFTILQHAESLDGHIIRAVGGVVTQLMAHTEILNDSTKNYALTALVDQLLNSTKRYDIEGLEFFSGGPDGRSSDYVLSVEGIIGNNRIVAINDFLVVEGEIIDISDTLSQPAYMMMDERDNATYIPLKYIGVMKYIVTGGDEARERYLTYALEPALTQSDSLKKISKRILRAAKAHKASVENERKVHDAFTPRNISTAN